MPTRTTNPDAPPEPGAEPDPADTADPIDDGTEAVELQNWEFARRPPTGDEVRALLESLPAQWGVRPVDYINFVQPLPARKKVKVPVIDQSTGEVRMSRGQPVTADEHIDVWTLYIGVAGRIAMLNAAAALNGWRVDLSPDPGAGGVGGFIELTPMEDLAAEGKSGRIVYREACSIWKANDDGTEICLGSKSGTAWVPARGGSQAAGTNPFEKCVVPGTRVLTDDLRWVPIEDLAPGDTLIGFDENPSGRGVGQRFRRATVEASKWLQRECVEVKTSSGTVVCSTDHMWLVSVPGTNRQWKAAADLRPSDRIVSIGEPWGREDSYAVGWLAGFLDGEGHIGNGLLRFTQKAGPVMDQAMSMFDKLGIPYTINTEIRPDGSHILRGHVTDGHLTSLRALGMLRPVRLLARAEDTWLDRRSFGKSLKVAVVNEVIPVGVVDVVAVQTSTRTFIAEGLFSHNCETAARGRAIAAWGIGILPGSGVASLEEMRSAQQIDRQQRRGGQQQQAAVPPANDPEVLRGQALTMLEEIRQLRGQERDEALANLAEYARRSFEFETIGEDGEILWDLWRPAQLQLLVQTLTAQLRKLRDQDSPI